MKELNGIIYHSGQANIAICLAFAKGIVVEREDAQVNWARFVKYTSKYQVRHIDSKGVFAALYIYFGFATCVDCSKGSSKFQYKSDCYKCATKILAKCFETTCHVH